MNFFEIVAHGKEFDVNAFLCSTSLPIEYSWRQGEQKRYACVVSLYKTSGISIQLGNGRELSIDQQQRVSVEFLALHRVALLALRHWPGVQFFFLRLQFRVEINSATIGFSVPITPRLMHLAAEIDMELMIHIDLDRKDWLDRGIFPCDPPAETEESA